MELPIYFKEERELTPKDISGKFRVLLTANIQWKTLKTLGVWLVLRGKTVSIKPATGMPYKVPYLSVIRYKMLRYPSLPVLLLR